MSHCCTVTGVFQTESFGVVFIASASCVDPGASEVEQLRSAQWEAQVDRTRTMVGDRSTAVATVSSVKLTDHFSPVHTCRPTRNGSEGPNYCFPYTFDLGQIAVSRSTCTVTEVSGHCSYLYCHVQNLTGALNMFWPESFTDEDYYCLW